MNTTVKKFIDGTINYKCTVCRGRCWDKNSQRNTQQNAIAMFGSIPNDCVNNADHSPRCPFALGLLN